MEINSNSKILITGGTGSFGRAFLAKLLNDYPNMKRIVIYSRDELKQWELQQLYPPDKYPNLRYFLGDIRGKNSLNISIVFFRLNVPYIFFWLVDFDIFMYKTKTTIYSI